MIGYRAQRVGNGHRFEAAEVVADQPATASAGVGSEREEEQPPAFCLRLFDQGELLRRVRQYTVGREYEHSQRSALFDRTLELVGSLEDRSQCPMVVLDGEIDCSELISPVYLVDRVDPSDGCIGWHRPPA